MTPDTLRLGEQDKACRLGLPNLVFAVTDHDEVRWGIELIAQHPEMATLLPFDGHLFHLGVTGLPLAAAAEAHAALQAACRRGEHDGVFKRLRPVGCLVVPNHPLPPWSTDGRPDRAASALLAQHGRAIEALEFNAMRSVEENRGVLELARTFFRSGGS